MNSSVVGAPRKRPTPTVHSDANHASNTVWSSSTMDPSNVGRSAIDAVVHSIGSPIDARGKMLPFGDRPQPARVRLRTGPTLPRQFERAVGCNVSNDHLWRMGQIARFDRTLPGQRFDPCGLFVQPQGMARESQAVRPPKLDRVVPPRDRAERPPVVLREVRRQDHRRAHYCGTGFRVDPRDNGRRSRPHRASSATTSDDPEGTRSMHGTHPDTRGARMTRPLG